MKYMGSKSRIKKHILPILNKIIEAENISIYIEPFVGGCNVIDSIQCENKIGNDISPSLIALFEYVQNGGVLLEEVTREFYNDMRANKNTGKYPDYLIGNVEHCATYNGGGRGFSGGYAKSLTNDDGSIILRNYYDEAKRNLEAQIPLFKNIKFSNLDYKEISYPKEKCLIYCDIPYEGTKQFDYSKNFNHNDFWEWAREMSKNHIVVVSEQNAPDDFKVIWELEVLRTQNNRKRTTATEKLFKL